jgi:aryl-alcohol dehydrogenase-like predicted oxidoreductase
MTVDAHSREGSAVKYRSFGRSGFQVSAIGLGGNTFGRACDERQTAEVVARALELGVNHFDCADTYGGGGVSERYLGRALGSRRKDVILTTKTGYPLGSGPNADGLSRWRIIKSCEDSLRRLGTDYVDVYYLHRPDARTDIDESLGALDDLVRQGKVRYAACSNYAGWEIARMCERAAAHGWAVPIVSQSRYSLLARQIEAEIVPACQAYGMGIVPFSPLAGGLLTGKYRSSETVQPGVRAHNNPRFERLLQTDVLVVIARLNDFAEARDQTLGALALAWLLAQPAVTSVITGVTSPAQVEANVAAVDCALSVDDLAELEAMVADMPEGLDT